MVIQGINLIFLSVLFLTPLLQATYTLGYEQIKVIFFIAAMLTSVALFLIYLLSQKEMSFFPLTNFDKVAIVFVTILVITSLTGIHPVPSFFGLPAYYQGALLYVCLLLFYLGVRFTQLSLTAVSFAFLLASVVVSIDALFQWIQLHLFHILIPTYNGRVVSSFGQPNLYSGFLLLVLPFSWYLSSSHSKKEKIFIAVSIGLSIAAIIISESRASIILLILLFGFYFVKLRRRVKKLFYPIIIVSSALLIVLSIVFIPRFIHKEIMQPLNNTWVGQNAPEKRILIWQVAVLQIVRRPVIGYGLESFGGVYADYFTQSNNDHTQEFTNRKSIVVTRAHNYLLDLLVFSGIGGGVWIVLIFLLFKLAKKDVFLISLLLYVLWVQVQIQSVVHLLYFWALAALIVNSAQSAKKK